MRSPKGPGSYHGAPSKDSCTQGKARTEPPWNVVLHNDWQNSVTRGLGACQDYSRHDRQEGYRGRVGGAHQGPSGRQDCYEELAEPYEDRLREKGLTTSIEPAG